MKSITYIISDVNKALAFEWIAGRLDKEKILLTFILLNHGPTELEDHLRKMGLTVYRVPCTGKKNWPVAVVKVYRILKKIKPNVVHCHLITANIIGLSAARLAGIKKRIYTRHHSSLHHTYFPKGVWWDKLSNKLATDIVAISREVKKILIDWEKVPGRKVHLIPHGFLLQDFEQVSEERINAFRNRWDLTEEINVIGVISRWTEWKGIQYIIPAFEKFLTKNSNAVLLLMNAQGDYENKITGLLKNIPKINYRIIKFEKDIAAAYQAMDIFVHVPVDNHSEAFGQIYIEALAAGIPSIFTLSGIAPDFIVNEQNALVVPFKNAEAIYDALLRLSGDKDLRRYLSVNGKKSVQEKFALTQMISSLEKLYD